jgi:hypothetical protein
MGGCSSRWENVDCIYMAQDRDQWQALVNTVTNLQVPYKEGIHTKNSLQQNMFIYCLHMLLKQITLLSFFQSLLVLLFMDILVQ